MSEYTVIAERSGKWWSLQAAEAPGALSQVTRLDKADEIIEAISFVTGEPASDISIRVMPVIPAAAQAALDEADRLWDTSRQAQHAAAEETRRAARMLRDELHLTVREVGSLLGVSHQRAHQLLSTSS